MSDELAVLIKWVLELQTWKAGEVTVGSAKRSIVLNSQRRQMRIHYQRAV